jgi:ribulose-phosphate 3-epimerase
MIDAVRASSRLHGLSLGLFAADCGRLSNAAEQAVAWGAAALHFDVMDGAFVPAITGGPGFVAALDVGLPRDVHLMVDRPSRHIAAFAEAGADLITIHAEASDALEAIDAVRAAAVRLDRPILVGLGLMPDTEIDALPELLAAAPDLILVLAVDPRRKAPPTIGRACDKLAALRARPWRTPPLFAFDGGVTPATIDAIASCAPDIVVSGRAVFAASDPKEICAQLAEALALGAAPDGAAGVGR